MARKLDPMTWESRGIKRDAPLKETSPVGTIAIGAIISLFGGAAGAFVAQYIFFHIPFLSINVATNKYYCLSIMAAGFILGTFLMARFLIRTMRHQQEYERQYGGRREE